MMGEKFHFAAALLLAAGTCAGNPAAEVACGKNALRLYANPLAYEVLRCGKTLVPKTGIGVRVDGKWLGEGAAPREVVRVASAAETVASPVYKKGAVDLRREEKLADFGDFAVRLVAREDGVAYRFELAKGGVVTDERADLTLPKAARCWFSRTGRTTLGCEEAVPESADASALATDSGKAFYLPFAYSAEGKSVAVLETALHDYPVWNFGDVAATDAGVVLSSLFAKHPRTTHRVANPDGWHNRITVETGGRWVCVDETEDFIAKAQASRSLPWRVFALADAPAKLCEADIAYALATPPSGDFSWVRPGKVAWDWWSAFDNKGAARGCTTETYRRFIDFAARNGVEYVLLDEGWSEKLDIWKCSPSVDVPALVEYAGKKGVGVILWMAWAQAFGAEERVAEHFSKLGAKGFKVDFMDRGDAEVACFLEKFAAACARHRMIVDYHGVYRPVGLSRTYPNVLNYEGVHGLEYMKLYRNEDMMANDVAAFFLRMTAGPMDYTPGAMDNYRIGAYRGDGDNPGSIGTRSRQMAMMALYEAPLQMLCDAPTKYERNRECLSFMAQTPVVWDATVGLGGSPETFAAVARKTKNGAWYAAGISGNEPRTFAFRTDFLTEGVWRAEMFRDADDSADEPTHYVHEAKDVRAGETLSFRMAPGGGFVVRFARREAPAAGFVRVSGTELVDEKGRAFRIRGTNLGNWLNPEGYMFGFSRCESPHMMDDMFRQLVGPEEAAKFWKAFKDVYITEDDIAFVAATGSNTVRLPFHYKLFTVEDYLGSNDPEEGFRRFDDVIGWCRKHGLRVILDMHSCPGGQTGTNHDDSYGYPWLFRSEALQREYCDIWRRIAARYADEPVVLAYDVMNEPIPWYHSDKDELNALMARVQRKAADAIREVDRRHVIIFAGAQCNSNFAPFDGFSFGENEMLSCHHYAFGKPNYDDKAVAKFAAVAAKANVPMYMGETGHNTYGWCRAIVESMEQKGIGWTIWPLKKSGGDCWLSFRMPDGWNETIAAFAKSDRQSYKQLQNRPERAKALGLMRQFIENCKAGKCKADAGYLRALNLFVPSAERGEPADSRHSAPSNRKGTNI
ncbi:MAG: glycoside hydrolase family 97 catalytic domain-containing protein [Kiritimatiellae bacterium]|nr:glycoside hydrolase family 97 catalytic domain-containing protein [Kiritimatiellia bacterium]